MQLRIDLHYRPVAISLLLSLLNCNRRSWSCRCRSHYLVCSHDHGVAIILIVAFIPPEKPAKKTNLLISIVVLVISDCCSAGILINISGVRVDTCTASETKPSP